MLVNLAKLRKLRENCVFIIRCSLFSHYRTAIVGQNLFIYIPAGVFEITASADR